MFLFAAFRANLTKIMLKLAPQYLIDLFIRNSNSSSHNLRNTDSDVQIPKKKHQMDRNASRIGVLKFGIIYRGMQIYSIN